MMMHDEITVAGLPLQFPKPQSGNQLPTLAEWNQRYIEYVLSFTKGKKTAAARILGINRRTLYRRKKSKGGVEMADGIETGVTDIDVALTQNHGQTHAQTHAQTRDGHQVQ